MLEFKKKKDLGQNFLRNPRFADLAVNALDIQTSDIILEVGAGDGAITSRLANFVPTPKKIISYEIDNELIPILDEKFKNYENVEIVNENFLSTPSQTWGRANKAIGAVPYYITSPIIHELIRKDTHLEDIVLIIQKEVADKIVLRNKTSPNYWSYLVYIYNPKVVANINRSHFNPAPNVDSTIIHLKLDPEKAEYFRKKRIEMEHWEAFLHTLFSYSLKMLTHNFDKEELEAVGISPTLRPHQLASQQVLDLFLYRRKSGIL